MARYFEATPAEKRIYNTALINGLSHEELHSVLNNPRFFDHSTRGRMASYFIHNLGAKMFELDPSGLEEKRIIRLEREWRRRR
jgi:hypothetical protein